MSEIVTTETHDDYLSKKGYVSASDIKKFKVSPKHYLAYKQDKDEEEQEKKALILGSAIHCYILEPSIFYDKYICLKQSMLPVADKSGNKTYRMKENREFRDNFKTLNPGKTVLDESDFDMIVQMCANAMNHPTIKVLFSKGQSEVSAYGFDEKTGFGTKGRADRIPDFGSCILDVKSCQSSDPKDFTRDVLNFGHHQQGAFYLELFDKKEFLLISIEKSEPYIPQVYVLDESVINQGRDENRMYMDILKWSKERNVWADYCEFKVLKDLYQRNTLYYATMEETMKVLDDFFEINSNTKGIHTIFLPGYYGKS